MNTFFDGQSALCPECDSRIDHTQVNLSEGVALCASCHTLTKLSGLNYGGVTSEEALNEFPSSVFVESGLDYFVVKISLRSVPLFLGSLAISAFWNGLVSVFVLFAVSGVFYHTIGFIPSWWPSIGIEDGVPFINDAPMDVGMTVYVCLFLLPFVVIGGGMMIHTLLRLFGSTIIELRKSGSRVSTGFSVFRFGKDFDARNVKLLRKYQRSWNETDNTSDKIEIVAERSIKFSSMLSRKQHSWTLAFLKALVLHGKAPVNMYPLRWLNYGRSLN